MGRLGRRQFLLAACAGSLVGSRRVQAQATRSYRIGWIGTTSLSFSEPYGVAFVRRLGELGFVEGRNLTIERRHADGKVARFPSIAAELGKLKCDVFFGGGPVSVLAAATQATRDAPVIFVAVDFDPVATGDVASLARPGGRVTGVTALQGTLPAKRLELLKEMAPGVGKVAVFANEQTTAQLSFAQGSARRMGIELYVIDFKLPPFDYETGFADAVRAKVDALFVLGSALWVPARRKIPELALKVRLPSVFHQAQWAEAGGLMSYGFNFPWMWSRGADIVANVLRGAKAGEIPMEQPTTFELAINLRTAKALDLTIPQAFLLRADRVIE